MQVRDLLNMLEKEQVERFCKAYREGYNFKRIQVSRQALKSFLDKNVKNLKEYHWQFLSSFFQKDIREFCRQKKESIYPKQIDTKNL